MELDFSREIEWAHKQWMGINFRAPPHPDTGFPQIEIVAFLGEFGGGKSFAAAARFFLVCCANPYVEGVHSGDDRPMSAIVAPTLGDLKKGPLKQLRILLGDSWQHVVVKERLYGEHQDLELFNGHVILCYSAKGALNGPSLCQIWVDEIQERCYLGQWDNYQGRVRDVRASWHNVQVSGIAERGFVEDVFRLPEPVEDRTPMCATDGVKGNRLTVLLFPEENEDNLAAGYTDELDESQPGSRKRDKDGWLLPVGAMYPTFSRDEHVRLPPGEKGTERSDFTARATSLSIDFGRKAAVLFGQHVRLPQVRGKKLRDRNAMLLVDQRMPDNKDAEELADAVRRLCWIRGVDKPRAKHWMLDKRTSVICLDPTTEPDQVRHFRRKFRGIRIVVRREGFYSRETNGVRAVDRALQDKRGTVRLFVAPWLRSHVSKRGVVEMFSGYLAAKPKDKVYEHAGDVVRYLVQQFVPLPLTESGPMDAEAAEMLNRVRTMTSGVTVSDVG